VRHDGAVNESPDRRATTGLRAFTRFFLFSILTLVFVAVGAISVLRGAPWSVAAAYALLAAGAAYLAVRVFPKRQAIAVAPDAKPAKRSGNPAVRTRAKGRASGEEKGAGPE